MGDLEMTAGEKRERNYDPHPAGSFMAVCRDIWKEPNPKAGQVNSYGKTEPDFKLRIEFLTDEPIEIGGKMLPRFIYRKFNPSWHEESNLRKFVKLWDPVMGKSEKANLETLIGRGAYVTITHDPNKKDPTKVWSNIEGIAPAPRGASIPQVPADFVRHKDRPAAPEQAAPVAQSAPAPAPAPIGDDDDSLPF